MLKNITLCSWATALSKFFAESGLNIKSLVTRSEQADYLRVNGRIDNLLEANVVLADGCYVVFQQKKIFRYHISATIDCKQKAALKALCRSKYAM